MNNYLAIIFTSEQKAHEGLRALWHLDYKAEITVHGASIVQRDEAGHINVANWYSNLGKGTAIGVSVGALLGILAGPIGVAAGMASAAVLSTSALGTAVGLGALAGGGLGVAVDSVEEDELECASYRTLLKLKEGEFAVLAEVSEDEVKAVNNSMQALQGVVHRRRKSDIANSLFEPNYYGYYLHPYLYEPPYYY